MLGTTSVRTGEGVRVEPRPQQVDRPLPDLVGVLADHADRRPRNAYLSSTDVLEFTTPIRTPDDADLQRLVEVQHLRRAAVDVILNGFAEIADAGRLAELEALRRFAPHASLVGKDHPLDPALAGRASATPEPRGSSAWSLRAPVAQRSPRWTALHRATEDLPLHGVGEFCCGTDVGAGG